MLRRQTVAQAHRQFERLIIVHCFEGSTHTHQYIMTDQRYLLLSDKLLEAYVKDWKDVSVDTFGRFDGIVSVGAFEHFCSVEEYVAGKQDQIYDHFFRLCHDLLPPGGRLYLQTMMLGRNAPTIQNISLQAQKGSNEYIA